MVDEVRTMTTYRRADGGDVIDEYAFVTGLEWFENDDEPTELIKEVWVLQEESTVVVPDPGCCTFDVDDDWCEADSVGWKKIGDSFHPRCNDHLTSQE